MKIKLFLIILILKANSVFSQDYNKLQFLRQNSTYSESYNCNGSTAIEKVEYLVYNNSGYVVVYFKDSYYDSKGKPYLYCNISQERWISFVSSGKSLSWGNAFHSYIEAYKCNGYDNSYYIKPEYEIQPPQESVNMNLAAKALKALDERYEKEKSKNQHNNNDIYEYKNNPEKELGYYDLNYKYSFGASYGKGIVEIFNEIKISNKATIQTQFNKFTSYPNTVKNIEDYKKQFGLSVIYNYYTSFYLENLFFVTGAGLSYSKSSIQYNNTFENNINLIFNLGLNYNLEKIPLSLGVQTKLDFGDYGNTGISLKYIIL